MSLFEEVFLCFSMPAAFVSCVSWLPPDWQPIRPGSLPGPLAVFRVFLPDQTTCLPWLRSWLSPDELDRASRYRQAADQHRFSCARGWLRLLVSAYTGQQPDQVRFTIGPNQKPELDPTTGWHINVSHAGSWVLIGIARRPIGVDVEEIRPDFPVSDLLPSTFSLSEQQYITSVTEPQRRFYQLWTRKEALIKATGQGLGNDPAAIPCLDGQHRVSASAIGQPGHWAVRSFDLTGSYSAAVASKDLSDRPAFYTLTPDALYRLALATHYTLSC
ncbi:4'-phosphopantetheinyl transferase [Spirosoma lacussanchae]